MCLSRVERLAGKAQERGFGLKETFDGGGKAVTGLLALDCVGILL